MKGGAPELLDEHPKELQRPVLNATIKDLSPFRAVSGVCGSWGATVPVHWRRLGVPGRQRWLAPAPEAEPTEVTVA